jgi:predicted ATP-dependent protease
VWNENGTASKMATKKCSKCGLPKDEEKDFSWSIRGIKRHSACNSCRTEERMNYYERNKEKELKYKTERQVNKRAQARHFVYTYLSSHSCVDCGESDPLVLTFDHVTATKKMDISQMVNQGYSLDAIQNEISKCEVRCGNCHMRIEKQRRGTRYC